jgi:hypothetical protein
MAYDAYMQDLSPEKLAGLKEFDFEKTCLSNFDKYENLISNKGYIKKSAVSEKSSTNYVLILIILIIGIGIGILIYHFLICKNK